MNPSTTKSTLLDLPYGIGRIVTSIIASRTPTINKSPVDHEEPTGTSKWMVLGVLAAVVSVIAPASIPFLAEVALRTLVQKAYKTAEDNMKKEEEQEQQVAILSRPSSSDIKWAEEAAHPIIPSGDFLVAFISECPSSPTPMRAIIIMNHTHLAERAFLASFCEMRQKTKQMERLAASPTTSSPAKSHADVAAKSHDSAPTCLGYFARAWDTVVTSSVLDPAADPFKSAAVMLNPDATPFTSVTDLVKSTLSPTAKPFTPIEKTLPAAPVAASMESVSMDSDSMEPDSMESVRMDLDSSSDEEGPNSTPDAPASSVPSSLSAQNLEHLTLVKRVQYLEKVLVRFENYQPTNLLPEGVNLALMKKRQDSSPRVAVDLEILLVKAMIDNIKIGQSSSSIDWDAWWVDVNKTLHDKYCSLAEHFITLANSF